MSNRLGEYEKRWLDTAKEVEWDGVCMLNLGDRYWADWGYMFDDLHEFDAMPEFVFATERIDVPYLDASDITCSIVEKVGADGDDIDFAGLEELQQALDAFREANRTLHWWIADHKRKIRVPGDVIAYWKDEQQ